MSFLEKKIQKRNRGNNIFFFFKEKVYKYGLTKGRHYYWVLVTKQYKARTFYNTFFLYFR